MKYAIVLIFIFFIVPLYSEDGKSMENQLKELLSKEDNKQVAHQIFSANSFNKAWEYIEKKERSEEDIENMILASNASLWHWKQRKDCKPTNLSVSYWQLGRVNNLSSNFELARFYGNKCVKLGEKENLPPFYIGYGYEILAHASALENKVDEANNHLKKAKEYLEKVTDTNEKKYLGDDLENIRKILSQK